VTPPTLTELACLGVVMKLNNGGTCSAIGDFLWGPWSNRPGSAPYARAAGRVLARLIKLGLAEKEHGQHHTTFRATCAGERAYAKDPALRRWKGGGK